VVFGQAFGDGAATISAVPEPAGLGLLAGGLAAALAAVVRRRRRTRRQQ
jgi:hypothetical protein